MANQTDLAELEKQLWRAARRSALHAAATGDEELAKRWRRLEKALDYANAAIAADPFTEATPSAAAQLEGDKSAA